MTVHCFYCVQTTGIQYSVDFCIFLLINSLLFHEITFQKLCIFIFSDLNYEISHRFIKLNFNRK